ncbi:DUF2269 family protein [Sphingomonas oligophenolica]|uniref:DUF2269 domain-containing protein n=1 Tax=Sphingomonas oligophenolica TaxID=301154 RepID=A0ABU9Y4Q4_9SPHN
MDAYLLVKTVHIISATILFGTGVGIANFFFFSQLSRDAATRRFAAAMTVRADFLFTLPAVIVQPLSGFWLVWKAGFAWDDAWLVWAYALYALAGICWVPVVLIQIRMKRMLEREAAGGALDQAAYRRLFLWWFALGWPAFGGLIAVFFLMVFKPT